MDVVACLFDAVLCLLFVSPFVSVATLCCLFVDCCMYNAWSLWYVASVCYGVLFFGCCTVLIMLSLLLVIVGFLVG